MPRCRRDRPPVFFSGRFPCLIFACLLFAGLALCRASPAEQRRAFDVPAGDAAETLKLAARQGGLEIIFFVETVRNVRTPAVRGEFPPREALARLVANTGLVVVPNEKNSTLTIQRAPPPTQPPTPAPTHPQSTPPSQAHPKPMKRKNSLAILGAWLALALAPGQAALAADGTPLNGTIEGRVLNATTGNYLNNARITVEGMKLEAFTDSFGQYRLAAVPSGEAKVSVFYTGLGIRTERVNVVAGQTVQHDITITGAAPLKGSAVTMETVKLDSFVVTSSKEMDGAAIAINEQRFAKNVMNVVSTDEFGTIADGSVGEFMKFLPGITSDYTGGDARRFSINGVPAGNVPISMGGFDMASAAGAGTGRQIELDQISINSVSRIEINRSPLPETPGAALAGSVNFVPRSAFERNKPIYNYSVAFLMKDAERAFLRQSPGPRWGQKTYKIHPGADVSAIVPVNKNFGFTVSAGYSLQYTPQDSSQLTWRGASAGTSAPAANGTPGAFPDTTPDNPYLTNYTIKDGAKNTERYSFGTTIDWRFAPNDRLAFGFQYAFLGESFAARFINFNMNRVEPGNWSRNYTHGAASTFPVTGAVNAGQLDMTSNGRIRPGRTLMPTLAWRHDGPIWKAESGISYSNSRIQYLDIEKGAFNGLTARRTNVTINFDDIYYLRPGRITVTDPSGQPVDPYNLGTYSIVSANSIRQITSDTKRQAFANLRRDLTVLGLPVSLKVGADVRTEVRDLRGVGTETYTYVGPDGRASTTPTTTAGLINDDSPSAFIDEQFSQRIPNFGFPKIQWVDHNKLWDGYVTQPNTYTRSATGDYTSATNASKRAQETIYSAYFRGDAAFFNGRLKLVGGIRAEQTNIDAEGPFTDPTRNFQRDAAGQYILGANRVPLPITTDALTALKLTLADRGYQAKKEYLRLFPNINAGYNITENLIARAAYYQTVGRPDFNQYAGGLQLPNTELVPSASNRITISNVSIKAWQAESYLARLEYYFGNVGQVSFAAFVRDYKNFFGTTTTRVTPGFLAAYGLDEETYSPFDVATQFNVAGNIRMTGLEFDYKQALTFLPHWARGVQLFVNASSQRAKGTDEFQDMNPFVGNWGLSLSRPKFNLRINENYRGLQRRGRITGRSIEDGTYSYRSKRLYIDVSGEYYFKPSLVFFIALRNLNDATEDDKIYGPNTPSWAKFKGRQDYGSLWTAGIKGSF
jgi:iron complex outermembrane receptor protein